MKSKGFTLVELIATMTLVAILATVILINMTGVKSNEDQNQADRFKKDVEEAACAYINMLDNVNIRNDCKDNGYNTHNTNIITYDCKIKVRDLASDEINLIDEDEIDPSTNKKASEIDKYVRINWVTNGEYKEQKCTLE